MSNQSNQFRHDVQDFIHRANSKYATEPMSPLSFLTQPLKMKLSTSFAPRSIEVFFLKNFVLLTHTPFVVRYCEWTAHSLIFNNCSPSAIQWDQSSFEQQPYRCIWASLLYILIFVFLDPFYAWLPSSIAEWLLHGIKSNPLSSQPNSGLHITLRQDSECNYYVTFGNFSGSIQYDNQVPQKPMPNNQIEYLTTV